MAESVRLTVVVDKSQLDGLKADVSKLGGKAIDLNVKSDKVAQAAKDVESVGKEIEKVRYATLKLEETTDVATGEIIKRVETTATAAGKIVKTVEQGDKMTQTVIKDFAKIEKAAKPATTATQLVAEALAGMHREYKSAAESAAAFQDYGLTSVEKALGNLPDMSYEAAQAQKFYSALGGVSDGYKSAKDSAEVFKMQGLTPLEKEMRNSEKAMADLSGKSESLISNIAKFTRWYIIGNVVSGVVRSLKEAVQTIKDVDSELVTVRKVTNMSADDLDRLKDKAYEVASAYGVSADAYLNSASQFARAGYREQIADLAELAVKTQLVGDVTEDVANQFLLSVDKAYKFNGSITELSKVLDGANELDNKYATSIEKIAEGLGTVAPVAAQVHVSVGELSAAIGTITAVTQRSGTEAARALRALMLNIVGDTKTEIDEGVTWTTGEIAGLRDVIRQYAPAAYEAAEATKSIINPMEAIGGLAQAMKEGTLSEQKLMEMVSDIGGKLRTSQLLALIQNWDMYKSMLEDFGDAAGSADKEVENALDSWERKTAQLKNSWTQLVATIVDTESVKAALDGIIALVDALNTKIGERENLPQGYSVKTMQAWIDGYIVRVGETDEATVKFRENTVSNMKKAVDAYYDGIEAGKEYTEEYQQTISTIQEMLGYYGKYTPAVRENTEAITENGEAQEQQAKAAKRAQVETDKLAEQTKAVNSALGDFKNYGNLTTETMAALTAALGDSINSLFDEEGALNDAGVAAFETAGKIDGVKSATEYLQIAAQQANYSNLIAQIQAAGTAAMYTAGQISVMLQAVGVSAGAADAQARGMAMTAKMKGTTTQGEFSNYLNAQIAALNRQMDALSGTGTSTKSGGSGGSKSSSAKDAELERLKDIVTLRKSELSLMEANGASEQDRIAKMREIQLALHAQAEYLRSIGADQSDINALSTEWWKLQNDILELTEKTEKALRDGAADALKNIADALGDEQNALKDITSEEEKRNAVLKARIALENALNERTVRQYNAKTGQWEWVANEKTVESARENLANAEKSLADFRNDAAYKALKAALNDAASAIKDGAMSFEEAYAYVKDAIAGILGEYGVDFSDKLGSVGAALGGAGKGETIDRMRRNSAAWHGASEEERRALEAENLRLGTAMGWTRGEDGVWYDENGNRAYDYGGVLRGMGGIKATRRDELILPPDLTQAVLRPALDRKTAAALDMMRAIYGTGSAVSPLAALMGRSSIGTQNNGDTFVINGMDVSQRVSMGTTIGELATLAHRLPLRYNS